MRRTLIVITGADGTGKSTLTKAIIERLCAERGEDAATHIQVWQALDGLLTPKEARVYLGRIGHRSRALLLLHAISRALDIAKESGAKTWFFDGYWYKYALTEMEHGAPSALFAGVAEAFPTPDLTIRLMLSPETAAERKPDITAYETGFADAADPKAAFIAFQKRLEQRWDALEAQVGPWVHLSSERPIDVLVADVVGRIG